MSDVAVALVTGMSTTVPRWSSLFLAGILVFLFFPGGGSRDWARLAVRESTATFGAGLGAVCLGLGPFSLARRRRDVVDATAVDSSLSTVVTAGAVAGALGLCRPRNLFTEPATRLIRGVIEPAKRASRWLTYACIS